MSRVRKVLPKPPSGRQPHVSLTTPHEMATMRDLGSSHYIPLTSNSISHELVSTQAAHIQWPYHPMDANNMFSLLLLIKWLLWQQPMHTMTPMASNLELHGSLSICVERTKTILESRQTTWCLPMACSGYCSFMGQQ